MSSLLSNKIYFKKFHFKEITLKKMLILGNHLNYFEKYNSNIWSYYFLAKHNKNNLLNVNKINKSLIIGLNFLQTSLINGARCLIIDTFKKNKYTNFEEKTIKELKSFFLNKLLFNNYQFDIFLKKYNWSLLTNWNSVKNNNSHIQNRKFPNKVVNNFVNTSNLNEKFYIPDIIFIDRFTENKYVLPLVKEIEKIKVPYIAINSFLHKKVKNDFYYVPNSKFNLKNLLFYWIIFMKLFLKVLLLRKKDFALKSIKTRILFKSDLFRIKFINSKLKQRKHYSNYKHIRYFYKFGLLYNWSPLLSKYMQKIILKQGLSNSILTNSNVEKNKQQLKSYKAVHYIDDAFYYFFNSLGLKLERNNIFSVPTFHYNKKWYYYKFQRKNYKLKSKFAGSELSLIKRGLFLKTFFFNNRLVKSHNRRTIIKNISSCLWSGTKRLINSNNPELVYVRNFININNKGLYLRYKNKLKKKNNKKKNYYEKN